MDRIKLDGYKRIICLCMHSSIKSQVSVDPDGLSIPMQGRDIIRLVKVFCWECQL